MSAALAILAAAGPFFDVPAPEPHRVAQALCVVAGVLMVLILAPILVTNDRPEPPEA